MSLNPTAQDSSRGFNAAILQADVRIIHAFSGSLFLTSDGAGRLQFWDIESPQIKVELRNSEQVMTICLTECLWIICIICYVSLGNPRCYPGREICFNFEGSDTGVIRTSLVMFPRFQRCRQKRYPKPRVFLSVAVEDRQCINDHTPSAIKKKFRYM